MAQAKVETKETWVNEVISIPTINLNFTLQEANKLAAICSCVEGMSGVALAINLVFRCSILGIDITTFGNDPKPFSGMISFRDLPSEEELRKRVK